jgi:hypothetical protein
MKNIVLFLLASASLHLLMLFVVFVSLSGCVGAARGWEANYVR